MSDHKHTPIRSKGNTTLTISLPKRLKEKLQEIARKERRAVSKQAVLALEEEAAKYGYEPEEE